MQPSLCRLLRRVIHQAKTEDIGIADDESEPGILLSVDPATITETDGEVCRLQ